MPSSGSTNTTTTQKFEPPEWTQQGWQDAASRARDLASEPFQQYGMQTVADLNPLQKSGLDMAVDYGMNSSPFGQQARQTGLNTMQGGFMGANPWLNQGNINNVINDNAANMTQAYQQGGAVQNDAMANLNGGFGGSGWQLAANQGQQGLAKQVGQMANQTRMGFDQLGSQDYNQERDRMQQAMGMAPGFSQDDMAGIRMVTGAGDAFGGYQQRLMDSGKAQFDAQVNDPQMKLQQYLNTLSQVSGTNGGQTSSQSMPGMSPFAGLLGLGAGAYGISQFLPK